jgi:hypothetical protein
MISRQNYPQTAAEIQIRGEKIPQDFSQVMNKTLTAHVGSKAEWSPTPKFRRTSQKRERLEDGLAKLLNSGYIQPGAKTRQLPGRDAETVTR